MKWLVQLLLAFLSETQYMSPGRKTIRIAFEYRANGQIANYSELDDQEVVAWWNTGVTDVKLRNPVAESR